MANKSVLELAVQTGQWDAGLKKAKTALQNFTDASGGLQKALTEDSASMQKFVQMMGRTDSQAKTAKGQLNDYKSTIEQLTMQYNQMNDAQKQSIGQDYLRSIDQLKQKYQAVNQQIQEMNRSLAGMPDVKPTSGSVGGGLFGGGKLDGMLQVFGGNVMTKIAGMGAGLVTELGDAVKQGIELAKQGEGIRIAFERLGRGDILQGLREATHGTVTDLELMKAAVKFNDFKLPLDELGTMLAFAQQKAKDTGQSVDYMVDSIVTGLGRKSLMILDNLGLSAAQIKERMAETGDMTKAVGAIIREEMAKAGDYVETAADRATQANVQLENAMTRLGETFQPLSDSATSMWTDIKVGALDLLNNAVKPLIKALQEAGALGQKARGNAGYENLGGDAKINRLIANLGDGKSPKAYRTYKAQMAEFDRYANSLKFKIASYGDDKSGIAQSAVAKLQTELAGVLTMRMEYDRRAQELHKKATAKNIDDNKEEEQSIDSLKKKLAELQEQRKKAIAAGDTDLSKNLQKQINQVKADIKGLGGTTTTTTHKVTTSDKITFDFDKSALAATRGIDTMPSVFGIIKDNSQIYGENLAAAINAAMGSISSEIDAAITEQEKRIDELRAKWATAKDATPEQRDSYMAQIIEGEDKLRNLREMQSISSTTNPQQYDAKQDISKQWRVGKDGQLTNKPNGKEDEDEKNQTAMLDGITAMNTSLQNIFGGIQQLGFEVPQELMNILSVMQTIVGIVSAIQTLSTVKLFGLAGGGIVPRAAGGYMIPGNSYSGDNVFAGNAWVNAGELVLNKAQQSTLAAQLQSSGAGSMQLEAIVRGEDLRFVLNSNGRRTGRGEIVTTNFR